MATVNRATLRCCVAVWLALSISSCCTGGLRKKIEEAHLKSGGAITVFKYGYPVIGVGYNNVYVAICPVPWRVENGVVVQTVSWWSDHFCMTREEFAALELRLLAIDDRARLDREEGFFAGMRGDHIDEVLASDEFLVGHKSAVDVKQLGVLHVNYD